MIQYDITVRPGQMWGDATHTRELTVLKIDERYAYCQDGNGRRTRILKRRMVPKPQGGYFLMKESPAQYIDVASETGDCKCGKGHKESGHLSDGCRRCRKGRCLKFEPEIIYHVWTGDDLSPPHCPCENFRWATRIPGEMYLCKHLQTVLGRNGNG